MWQTSITFCCRKVLPDVYKRQVSIYFGSGFAFLASGCFFLLFFLSLFVTKLRTSKVVPIACLVTAVALSAYAGYHVWKIEPLAELAEKDASITGTLCELPYENNGKFYYTLRIDEIEIEGMEHPHNPGKIIMTTRNALDIEPYGSISGKDVYKRQDISKDTSMDENKYIELTKTQMEKAIPGITFSEQGKRTIAGQEFYELPYSYTKDVDGTQTTITQTFLCKKIEDRMVCITLTYPDQETIDHLLSGFSELNATNSQ